MSFVVRRSLLAISLFSALGFLGLSSSAAWGQSPRTTWRGTTDDNWNNAANWTVGLPGTGSTANLNDGATARTTAAAPQFDTLNLRNGAGTLTFAHQARFATFRDLDPVAPAFSPGSHVVIAPGATVDVESGWTQGSGGQSILSVEGGTLRHSGTNTFSLTSTGRAGDESTINLSSGALRLTLGRIGAPSALSSSTSGEIRSTVNISGGTFQFLRLELGADPLAADTRSPLGVVNISGGTLASNSGFLDVGHALGSGIINMSGGNLANPRGTVFVSRTGAFNMSGGTVEALNFGGLLWVSGRMQQTGGVVNATQVLIRDGGSYLSSGPATVVNASIYIKDGLFRLTDGASIHGSLLSMDSVNGTFTGSGLVDVLTASIGGSVEPDLAGITITGPTTFAGSKVSIDFTNPALTDGTFDVISNDGQDRVTFGGELDLRFAGGDYQPGTVAIFKNWGSFSGAFATVNVAGLPDGQTATFNAADGTVTIVPEPATLGVLALASLMVGRRQRR